MARPLTPPACDLRGLPFMPLECARLLDSDLYALTTGDEFKAALALWCKSWSQVPAASMANDEKVLARACGVSLAEWRTVSEMALKGWVECDDGRLYHPVVAEKALTAWLDRIANKEKSAKGSATRYPDTYSYDPEAFARDRREALFCLAAVAPAVAREKGYLPQAAGGPAPSTPEPAPSTAPGTGLGCEVEVEGTIPVGASVTPDARAWREAVALLTLNGRMAEPAARKFFAKLLRDHKLEPHQLLPSIVSADLKGTPDPQGYLVAAAKARSAGVGPTNPAANVAGWGDDEWGIALDRYRTDGAWSAEMGPEPGEPGCWVPAHLLTDTKAAA